MYLDELKHRKTLPKFSGKLITRSIYKIYFLRFEDFRKLSSSFGLYV